MMPDHPDLDEPDPDDDEDVRDPVGEADGCPCCDEWDEDGYD
jgi:hypothetical protein